MVRSAGSIGADIAEGFNRSKAKYLNSLDIALGEAHESENGIHKLRDAGFVDRDSANQHVGTCITSEKMLSALIRAIRSHDPAAKSQDPADA